MYEAGAQLEIEEIEIGEKVYHDNVNEASAQLERSKTVFDNTTVDEIIIFYLLNTNELIFKTINPDCNFYLYIKQSSLYKLPRPDT